MVIHPYVNSLPGLLLLVDLAVQSDVDHQTTWPKSRQVGYPRNGLLMNTKDLQRSCLWVRHCWKEPNLPNPPLATFDHFGASQKALSAGSLTFEQRQIKGQPWWQNWPIFMLSNVAVGLKTYKRIVWGPHQQIWKCRNSPQKPEMADWGQIFRWGW